MSEQDCVFCKIGRGEIPSEKLFDDGVVFAIRDIKPKAPVHVLLIPYAHVEALTAASEGQIEAASHCLSVAPAVASSAGGMRRGLSSGRESGPGLGTRGPALPHAYPRRPADGEYGVGRQ